MKKLVRNQLKVVTGGVGCNPSAGIDCPRNTVCCALEWNSPSGVCKKSQDDGACWAPNP
ncbi:hypothetical protein [Elizabethkingia ursingii]|uniref:hypothetical protein n=1 Tax=Elizabethkingia ursingii TaxID=1756150 RepID=UPI000AF85659|nr:hypothetical protein [Elizabethkingia ursingii]